MHQNASWEFFVSDAAPYREDSGELRWSRSSPDQVLLVGHVCLGGGEGDVPLVVPGDAVLPQDVVSVGEEAAGAPAGAGGAAGRVGGVAGEGGVVGEEGQVQTAGGAGTPALDMVVYMGGVLDRVCLCVIYGVF